MEESAQPESWCICTYLLSFLNLSSIINLIILLFVVKKAYGWAKYFIVSKQTIAKAKDARLKRDTKIYEFKAENKEVLSCKTIQDLLKGQFEGRFTCRDIITTYVKRSYTIGRGLELSADEMFDYALEEADKRDRELQECLNRKGNPYKELGKLHGIPFSVKDHLYVKGTLCTVGVGSLADYVCDKDLVIVKVYKDHGAIPIVKGNLSMACMSYHTKNIIWGEAKNPWNNDRSTGGSSGGDAGLLAAGCVQFSIGGDLVGSIRVPSAFCGVIGFLPTPKRASIYGYMFLNGENGINMEILRPAGGPLTRNMDDLLDLYRLTFSNEVYDEDRRLPRVLFNEDLYQSTLTAKSLTIGVISNYEAISGLSPAIKRAIKMGTDALIKKGHKVIEVDIPHIESHSNNVLNIAMANILELIYDGWCKSNDYLDPHAFALLNLSQAPRFIIKLISKILRMKNMNRHADMVESVSTPNIDELKEWVMIRKKHLEEIEQVWKKYNLDAMIIPTYPIPAFKCEDAADIALLPCGARFAIYWGYCSGFIPITCVKEDEETFEENLHHDLITDICKRTVKGSTGMPVGFEVCSLPFRDEKALAIMKIIEQEVKFQEQHPYPY